MLYPNINELNREEGGSFHTTRLTSGDSQPYFQPKGDPQK